MNGVREVVRPPCGVVTWSGVCVSCGIPLPTRYYAELHLATPGTHILADVCPVHGVEATVSQ